MEFLIKINKNKQFLIIFLYAVKMLCKKKKKKKKK